MAWSCILTAADGGEYEFHDVANGKALVRLQGRGFPSVNRLTVGPALLDGNIYKSIRYGSRLLVAEHAIQGSSYSDLMDKRLGLAAVISPKSINIDGSMMTLQWRAEIDQPTYELDVQIAAEVSLDGHAGLNTELYTIPLVADNPFWRKLPAATTELDLSATGLSVPISVPLSLESGDNTAVVNNAGNAISYPIITITAGLSGAQNPRIVNTTTDEEVRLNYIMAAGDVIVIDMANRTIVHNGSTNIIRYRTAESVAWGLVSGANTIEAFLAGGTANFSFSHYDLYAAV